MPLEQTVTIVNNSGKIISTGKQLLSIFKEAKGAYQDKKAELHSERSVRRSQTFDASRSVYRHDDSAPSRHGGSDVHGRRQIRDGYDDDDEDDDDGGCDYKDDYGYDDHGHDDYYHSYGGRRHSHDVASETGSRRSRRSSRHGHRHRAARGGALTESNLKTLSEVSSTTPSRAARDARPQRAPPSAAYRPPYAETMPLDMALSRLDVSRAAPRRASAGDAAMLVPRRRSEPELAAGPKDIDMNLAYGNIPPDLADRVDLDPGRGPGLDASRAQQLVHKVEGLLDEAHCLQHSATSIIKSLQEKPDAAAEVALTLADLSSAVAKMSPSLLGLLKGGSPAVFALLASPQFLIGTGIAVGVTVVMFGGWRIVKKVAEARAPREAMALEGVPQDRPAPLRTQTEYAPDHHPQGGGIEEALVVDEELSTIETWRRGIQPFGPEAETADLELITPQADRATRQKYAKDDLDAELRSYRSSRTRKSSRSHRSKHPKESGGRERDPLETGSSAGGGRRRSTPEAAAAASVSGGSDARSRRSGRSAKDKPPKALEGGSKGDGLDGIFRSRARHGDNMLKAIFRNKKEKEAGGGGSSKRELVLT